MEIHYNSRLKTLNKTKFKKPTYVEISCKNIKYSKKLAIGYALFENAIEQSSTEFLEIIDRLILATD